MMLAAILIAKIGQNAPTSETFNEETLFEEFTQTKGKKENQFDWILQQCIAHFKGKHAPEPSPQSEEHFQKMVVDTIRTIDSCDRIKLSCFLVNFKSEVAKAAKKQSLCKDFVKRGKCHKG